MRRSQRLISTVLAAAAGTATVSVVYTAGLSTADELASVLTLMIILGTYLFGLFRRRPEPQSVSQIRERLADQIDAQCGPIASDGGIYQHQFLPPRLCRSGSDASVLPGVNAAAWDAERYQRALATVFGRKGTRRAVVLGESGGGKSTLGLMLALGLRRVDRRALPLLFSVSGWNVEDESFQSWLDRQLTITYRAAEALGEDRIKQLAYCDDVLFILDGLDGLGETRLADALAQINKTIPPDRPLIVLSRPIRSVGLGALGEVFQLRAAPTSAVRRYLRFMSVRHGRPAGWQSAAELLRSPLLLDMALRVDHTEEEVAAFVADVRRHTVKEARNRLIDGYLDMLERTGFGPERLARLAYVAHRLGRFRVRSIAWWRISDAVPSRVLAVGAALSLVPAYLLALVMPAGLTRGLALGTFTGVLIGVTRARPLRRAAGPAAVTALLIVAAIGARRVAPGVAIADAVEIPLAVFLVVLAKNDLVVLAKNDLIGPRSRSKIRIAGVIAAIGLVPAAAVAGLHALWPSVGADRGFAGVWLAVSFGVAVAVLSARLLIPLDRPVRPSRMTLRSRGTRLGSVLPHVSAAIASAMAVGVAGGVIGALRDGPVYGATLTVFFGLVAGIPIGVAGGLLRWLNQPTVRHVVATPVHTLRSDWLATAGCLVTVSAVSSVSIAAVLGPLHRLTPALTEPLLVRPVHGLLFGATIGLILACYYNAAPGFLIAACWFALTNRLPLRLMSYLRGAESAGLLRRVGAVHEFRHEEIRARLAIRHGDSELRQRRLIGRGEVTGAGRPR